MNKYSDKSYFEINKAVAEGRRFHWYWDEEINKPPIIVKGYVYDPCNTPADAMPIIIENGICMYYVDKDIGWAACHFDEEKGELEIYDKNYYRAAMICFLLMKDAENEKL